MVTDSSVTITHQWNGSVVLTCMNGVTIRKVRSNARTNMPALTIGDSNIRSAVYHPKTNKNATILSTIVLFQY